MPSNFGEHQLCFLVCCLLSCQAFANGASEILDWFQDTSGNTSQNRARSGERRFSSTKTSDQVLLGCRELRSMKYVSDGQCTSLTPVKELVCAGDCLPIHIPRNWIGTSTAGSSGTGGKLWGRHREPEWRCVTERTRNQSVRLRCRDGGHRTYRITVVTSCKCAKRSASDGLTRDRTRTKTQTLTQTEDQTLTQTEDQTKTQTEDQTKTQIKAQTEIQTKTRRGKRPSREDWGPAEPKN